MHAFETRGEGWLLSSLFQPPFRLLPFMQLLAKHIIVGSRHQRTWSYGKSILALTSSSIYRRGKRPSPLLQYFSFSCFAKLSTNNALYIQSVPFINQLDRTVPSIRIECFVVCKKSAIFVSLYFVITWIRITLLRIETRYAWRYERYERWISDNSSEISFQDLADLDFSLFPKFRQKLGKY